MEHDEFLERLDRSAESELEAQARLQLPEAERIAASVELLRAEGLWTDAGAGPYTRSCVAGYEWARAALLFAPDADLRELATQYARTSRTDPSGRGLVLAQAVAVVTETQMVSSSENAGETLEQSYARFVDSEAWIQASAAVSPLETIDREKLFEVFQIGAALCAAERGLIAKLRHLERMGDLRAGVKKRRRWQR